MSAFWIQQAAGFTLRQAGAWGREQPALADEQGLPCWESPGALPFERYPRLDPLSKLVCWLAEQTLPAGAGVSDFGLVLATRHGCIEADLAYYRTAAGDAPELASPKLFPYTLPSAGLAETAIRRGIHGPALVVPGGRDFSAALSQAWNWLQATEISDCLVLSADAVLAGAAVFLSAARGVEGYAFHLSRTGGRWPLRRKGCGHELAAAELWAGLGHPSWQHPDWSLG